MFNTVVSIPLNLLHVNYFGKYSLTNRKRKPFIDDEFQNMLNVCRSRMKKIYKRIPFVICNKLIEVLYKQILHSVV